MGVEDKINKALKLARFLKDKLVWAVLGAFALSTRDTSTAEICLSELDCLEKVQFLLRINNEDDEIL